MTPTGQPDSPAGSGRSTRPASPTSNTGPGSGTTSTTGIRRSWLFVRLIRMGFGMDWYRTLHAAWLALRAIQLWAPLPDNDPDGARARMRRFYALVRLSHGEPASPAKAAELEVDWWRVHRQVQYSTAPGVDADDLVESVTRLYSYLFGEPEAEFRPAAVHRVRAMGLSDQRAPRPRRPERAGRSRTDVLFPCGRAGTRPAVRCATPAAQNARPSRIRRTASSSGLRGSPGRRK